MNTDRTEIWNETPAAASLSQRQTSTPDDVPLCPICNKKLEPSAQQDGSYACAKCGYVYTQAISFEPGSILLGKYRILNRMNSGAGGDIYLCNPVGDSKTRYVLKVLKNMFSFEGFGRFEREARVLQLLNHPNIVNYIDYFETSAGAFLVMEHVDGSTLSKIGEKYSIDEEAILQIALSVARALRSAWDTAKIIHRDIKPSNIMINTDMEVKLLDFGIAKQTNCEATGNLTANNSGMGTPGYMSPEQYTDARSVNFKSDIYSLGATMYYLLKKNPPISTEKFYEAYQQTVKNSPPQSSMFYGLCSNECAELIRNMMERDPAKRPENYDIIINNIKALLKRFD